MSGTDSTSKLPFRRIGGLLYYRGPRGENSFIVPPGQGTDLSGWDALQLHGANLPEHLPQLLEAAEGTDVKRRRAALSGLANFLDDSRAVDALTRALWTEDERTAMKSLSRGVPDRAGRVTLSRTLSAVSAALDPTQPVELRRQELGIAGHGLTGLRRAHLCPSDVAQMLARLAAADDVDTRRSAFRAAGATVHFEQSLVERCLASGPCLEAGEMLLRMDCGQAGRVLEAWLARIEDCPLHLIARAAVGLRQSCPQLLERLLPMELSVDAIIVLGEAGIEARPDQRDLVFRSLDEETLLMVVAGGFDVGSERVLPVIKCAVASPDPLVRLHGVQALRRQRGDPAVQIAAEALVDEPDPLIAANLMTLLGRG